MKFGRSLRSAFWRGGVEDEVDSELDFHVEMRVRELIDHGMKPELAREAAIRRFGDINKVNAACRDIGRRRYRDMRRTEYVSELKQDATFAFRHLFKNPAFTVVAVLTLSLGIGATTAIFSAVQAVVLRPLPVPEPERIFAVHETWNGRSGNMSGGNFTDALAATTTFSDMTAIQYSSFNLSDTAGAERVIGARATASFWKVFGVAPAVGRVFRADEDQPGREHVVVLSNRLWRERFGADPSVVGRQARLNGRPYQVIGVMPASFDFTDDSEQLWVPVAFTPERKAMHDEHFLTVYGRLKDGVSADQALAEMVRTGQALEKTFPRDNAGRGLTLTPIMTEIVATIGSGCSSCSVRSGSCCLSPAATSRTCCSHVEGRALPSWQCARRSAPDGAASFVSSSRKASSCLSCRLPRVLRSRCGAFGRWSPRRRRGFRGSSRLASILRSSPSR